MRVRDMIVWMAAVLILLAGLLPAYAQVRRQDLSAPDIVINLPARTLSLYTNGTLVKEYSIAIGKPSTPTPLGNFYIYHKEVNPWWFPPERKGFYVPPGPDNPLGYRWMEFAPMYGIHGTNAPWSIGGAVSNGCIRMHEADVEELFEIVPRLTPVKVQYERMLIRTETTGQVIISLYPDIYGYQPLTSAGIKERLAPYGLKDWIGDAIAKELARDYYEYSMVLAEFRPIYVNGQVLRDNAVIINSIINIPVRAVASALKIKLAFNDTGTVNRQDRSVNYAVKGDEVFVVSRDAEYLFNAVIKDEKGVIKIDAPVMKLNNEILTGDIQIIDGAPALPVYTLAEALGDKVTRRHDGRYYLRGKALPVKVVSGEPYIKTTELCPYFNTAVEEVDDRQNLLLKYPWHPIDYSMFLDLMGEFTDAV